MKTVIQIVLVLIILGLGYILADNISTPIRFEKEYQKRKEVVVERLKDIRTIQVAYKSIHGEFTDSFDSLIDFYKHGQIKLVKQIGSMDDSLAVAQGRVRRDTVLVPVKDTVFNHRGSKFNIENIGVVPFTSGAKFEMRTKVHTTISGIVVPLFEACVPNKVFLEGLDEQQIVNMDDKVAKLNEVLGAQEQKYPGLKVGNITHPNNNAGNWE